MKRPMPGFRLGPAVHAIHNTPAWEKQIKDSALEKGAPRDSMLLLNARYMVEQYLLTNDLF